MMQKKKRLREFWNNCNCLFARVFGENFRVFPTTVKASMKPTLQDGDKVIVNKLRNLKVMGEKILLL